MSGGMPPEELWRLRLETLRALAWAIVPDAARAVARICAMTIPDRDLSAEELRRICDALRYLGRDLHHRSFSVTSERRELLWQEMDQCLALADRLSAGLVDGALTPTDIS